LHRRILRVELCDRRSLLVRHPADEEHDHLARHAAVV
jgi:hypothetical protein